MRRCGRLGVAAALAVALLAAACGRGDSPSTGPLAGATITFSVSLAEEEKDAVRELLDRFQETTGATVELVSVTSADLSQKLQVEAQARRPTIHLFAQDNLALRVLVDRGLVQDLSEVQIPHGLVSASVPDRFYGKQHFLPFRPNVRVAYVNRERFAQAEVSPPQNVEELRAVAQRFKAVARTPKLTLSLAEGDPAAATISEWIVSFGGDPLVINDEGSQRAFEFLQGLWKDGLLARESLQAKYDTEVDNLRGEIAWLAQNWTFTSGILAGEGLLDRFGVYEGWTGPARSAHVIGGDVLGIPKGVEAKSREAALQLANHLMSKQAQELLVRKNAWLSIYPDVYDRVPRGQRPTFEAGLEALESGWRRPNVPYWPEVSDALNEAVRKILQREEPVGPVLGELHAKISAAAGQKQAEYPPAP